MITVYKYNSSEPRAVIDPDATSQQERRIMAQDIVTLGFSVAEAVDLQIGDQITVFNAKYELAQDTIVTKVEKRNYEYRAIFEGVATLYLGKTQYLFLDANNDFTEGRFNINATALDFLTLLIYNLRRNYPDIDWQLGYVVESGFKNLKFDGNNCLEVLAQLAEEFETEWLIEGYKINLYKKQTVSGLTLRHGQNEGLYAITRQNQDNSNVITRLYGYGSNRNIGDNYRNGAQRLRMANSLYLEKNTTKYPPSEATVVFEDVYPRREGVVSSVETEFVFTDADIDFDVNDYLLPGVAAQLTFNTGQLAGYTFEIASFDYATKKFTINLNKDEQTVTVPSDLLKPAIGDKYVVTEITMPLANVEAAEAELQAKVQSLLDERSVPKLSLSVLCDPIWFKRNAASLNLGLTVGVVEENLNIDRQIRIVGFVRNIRQPFLYSVELSDTLKETAIVKLIKAIK